MSKINKNIIIITLIIAFHIIILGIFIVIYVLPDKMYIKVNNCYNGSLQIEGEPLTSSNDDYSLFIDEFKELTSNSLITFPNKVIENNLFFGFNYEFLYSISENPGGIRYKRKFLTEIYLYCDYDSNTFYEEINRLDSLMFKGNELYYVTGLFDLPCYVAVYNYNYKFEYVIIDSNNFDLFYIYLSMIDESNLVFRKDFFPKKSLYESSFPKRKIDYDYYNIYD